MENGALECFSELLDCEDPKIIFYVLKGIHRILLIAKKNAEKNNTENKAYEILESSGAVKKIKELGSSQNKQLAKKALAILEMCVEIDE